MDLPELKSTEVKWLEAFLRLSICDRLNQTTLQPENYTPLANLDQKPFDLGFYLSFIEMYRCYTCRQMQILKYKTVHKFTADIIPMG